MRQIRPAWIALALFVVALGVYLVSNTSRHDWYNHFVWQADAFLHGRSEIAYPVLLGKHQNSYFQDVLPIPGTGRGWIPFPPLPAVILMPFVTIFGLDTNEAVVAAVIGALNVSLCWALLVMVAPRRSAALLGTIFYGFGTVAWYAAMLGSTWYLAHLVASSFLFMGIGIAVRFDPDVGARARSARRVAATQLSAGLLFGLGTLARLTTLFGAPFFAFVGTGRTWLQRALWAGAGAAIPVALLLAYNLATTGSFLHPAYQYLFEHEYRPEPELFHRDWGIEDPRYIPQNAVVMLAWLPERPLLDDPACANADVSGAALLFDVNCPLLRPDPFAMSILLTSPGYLLIVPALLRLWRRRIVVGAALAVASIALVDLMHFSQGWVQFGYRFSNDFAPFAVILVALGIARVGIGAISLGLVAASVAINAWGVYWGVTLGW